jgi:two-component system, NarL family, response regulator LiaR
MKSIRILVVDDHALIRQGVRMLLSTEANLELVGEAVDGLEAIQKVIDLQPEVVLMDLVMPRMGGIEAIREIKSLQPQIRILVLTSFAEDDKVFPAIKAGALGYILKDSTPAQLVEAIHKIYLGEPSLHPTIAMKLINELIEPSELPLTTSPLTQREVEILKLLAQGMSNQEISVQLMITGWTVQSHVRNILSKLHLANRTQAALYALREGISNL